MNLSDEDMIHFFTGKLFLVFNTVEGNRLRKQNKIFFLCNTNRFMFSYQKKRKIS